MTTGNHQPGLGKEQPQIQLDGVPETAAAPAGDGPNQFPNRRELPAELQKYTDNDLFWATYDTVYWQILGGKESVILTKSQLKNGGAEAVLEAYTDAVENHAISGEQAKPSVIIFEKQPRQKAQPPAKPRRSFKEWFLDRRLPVVAVSATWLAFCGAMTVNAAMDPDESGTDRFLPTSVDIAEFRSDTNAMCPSPWDISSFQPTGNVRSLGGKSFVYDSKLSQKATDNLSPVVITGVNTTFTVPRNETIDKLFVCADKAHVEIIGNVNQLGIKSNESSVQIAGKADRIFMDNSTDYKQQFGYDDHEHEYGWSGSKLKVSGQVGDVILHGDDNSDEDIEISGSVENVLESDDNYVTFPDVDTRGDGRLGRHVTY